MEDGPSARTRLGSTTVVIRLLPLTGEAEGVTNPLGNPKTASALAVLALALPACGGDGDNADAGGGDGGCLSAAEVERQVNKIAAGIEGSSAEVEAKQAEIREIRAQQCK